MGKSFSWGICINYELYQDIYEDGFEIKCDIPTFFILSHFKQNAPDEVTVTDQFHYFRLHTLKYLQK